MGNAFHCPSQETRDSIPNLARFVIWRVDCVEFSCGFDGRAVFLLGDKLMRGLPKLLTCLVFASVPCLPVIQRAVADAGSTSDKAEEIAGWIGQLDSNRFAERKGASQKLEAAGQAAIPALATAAVGDSREVTLRALDILRKHLQEGDEFTKAAATEALQQIAAGDHASAARRAKDILNPPKPPAQLQPMPIAPQQIQIQFKAAAGNQVRRVQINNGVKQTETTDGDRKVKIVETPAGTIQIEVTEKKNGKETTRKFEAKNADDLKKNHPEGHKLYEKYGRQQGPNIQIRGFGVPGLAPINPPAPAQQAGRVDLTRKSVATQLRAARRLIESSSQRLRQARAGDDGDQKLREASERLKKIAQQLEQEEAALTKAE